MIKTAVLSRAISYAVLPCVHAMKDQLEYSEAALQKVREDRLLIDEVDNWLFELIEPFIGQRVLEIGCGLGNFTHHLTDRELYIGTDISAESVNHVKNRFGRYENMSAYVADAADKSLLELSQFQVDTVFSLNVFEHIEDDRSALINATEILQPGGTIILVVPAHDWLYGKMDQSIGHYRRYSKRSMSARFDEARLSCVKLQYVNILGAVGWFVNGRVLKQQTPPAGQLQFFNRIVPLLKRVESAVSAPMGISLLSVGRKQT